MATKTQETQKPTKAFLPAKKAKRRERESELKTFRLCFAQWRELRTNTGLIAVNNGAA